MMNDLHKKVMNEILGRGRARTGVSQQPSGNDMASAIIVEKDKAVRKTVSDLYSVLSQINQPELAIKLLAEHASIIVDMINEFKGKK